MTLFRTRGVRREVHLLAVDPHHRLAEPLGHLREDLRVVVVRHRLHDGARALRRLAGFEDAGSDEDAVHAQLHHERGVRGRRDAPRGEVHDGEAPERLRLAHELERRADLLRVHEDLILGHGLKASNVAHDGAAVAHRLDDVPGASLA
eukprot:13097-Pelagococcus_subviridis.AAC.3